MAISKIQYKSSPSATPTVWMDVTGKTVTSASMRNGTTALKNDGTDITGNIPDMTLPSSASGSSSGTSKATITPTSSAQYLNIPAGYLDAAQYYTIAAASGGASNMVTGTFKGTTTGAAMDVTLSYSGDGYPIAVMIFASNTDISTFNSLIQRYAIRDYFMDKYDRTHAPSYASSGNVNVGYPTIKYKNSTSNGSQYSQTGATGSTAAVYEDVDATSSASLSVKIRSNKKMSVFIASTSYGFAANIEYRYYVIYSS